ncbi:hypothetical protein [Streptomyces sp. 3214.6]|uniref:hypothetical protein n=1 Tax=Streptomyces sp. 3214.6 TaxID=1882757 RepID=UPI0009098AB0|nr:hypothetical protein [Streptomyces sp. 3214.6]SHI65979.1 hypothetical protein SAMN05444521_8163 [Streptomyces sp. 3214.6]
MSTLMMAAFAVGTPALIGLAFGLPDAWFCGLLALACVLGGADAAYREQTNYALGLLICAAMFSGGALHALIAAGRDQRRQR